MGVGARDAPIRSEHRLPATGNESELELQDWANLPRSSLPAITHVDYSARIQSVSRETNPRFHGLLEAFQDLTGCGLMVNTSFNVRGEPIVCTPEDAYRCFMRTEMDVLVLGNQILLKQEQPELHEEFDWREQYALD